MNSILHTILTFLGLSPLSSPNLSPSPPTVHSLLATLLVDPNGFTHIADDGIARSYDSQRKVIDYVRLSNAQLAQYLEFARKAYASDMEHLHEVFDGVDGWDVGDEGQLLEPGEGLRPVAKRTGGERAEVEVRFDGNGTFEA